MKKIFLILILFLSCYFIYNKTIDNKLYFLAIGDSLARGTNEYGVVSYGYNDFVKDYLNNNNRLKYYNKTFTNNDYMIDDIIKIIEYNEQKDNKSLNRLIKQADIITISLGMNDLYYKLAKNNQNIYTYIDSMINDYNKIIKYINNFHHDKVYVLGYYSTLKIYNDIFNYANYKLKEICDVNNVIYVDVSNILKNNDRYMLNTNNFNLNIDNYERISQIIVENLKNT